MRVLSLVFLGLLCGCASMISGGKQSITVVTPDAVGSECSLTDSKGRVWYVENTPGTALVKKGDGPISVICKKEGYEVGVGQVKENVAMATSGNILFPVGFLVDSMTGSAERYDSMVTIDMEPTSKGGSNRKPWE